MKRTGIICEFNPFHKGHARLIRTVRETTGGQVVCVMSGSFVQRGEPAIMPASWRAAAAVEAGADAVFELPFPWSASSAEFFAGAGIKMLRALGCDSFAFGSESADLDYLSSQAAKPLPDPAKDAGTASGFDRLDPNDVLAVEYLRAASRQGGGMTAIAVKREGSHLSEENSPFDENPSSSGIRRAILAGDEVFGLTGGSSRALRDATAAGECPASAEALSCAVTAFWRLCDPVAVSVFAECGSGVAGRLKRAALAADGFEDMMKRAATKKYTNARLRRAVWFGMTGATASDLRVGPAYARVLALGPDGRKILAGRRSFIPIVTRVRDIPDTESCARQFELSLRADSLFSLSLPVPADAARFIRRQVSVFDGPERGNR